MSVLNALASFGKDTGDGITTGLNEMRRRKESDRNYEVMSERNRVQDERYQNQLARYAQQDDLELQKYHDSVAKQVFSGFMQVPDEQKAAAYPQALKMLESRGVPIDGDPTEWSPDMLPKIQMYLGGQQDSKAPSSIQEMQYIENIINNPEKYPDATVQAARIKAGLDPRAVGSSSMTIVNTGMTEPVARSEGVIAGQKAGQSERAKLIEQGQYRPELERDIAQSKASGKATGEAIAGLPGAEAEANSMMGLLDKVLTHPGLDAATGKGSILNSVAIPGTDRKDFLVLMDQLQGKAFLQAFESLKGGGQITEVEGKKATEAMGRMNTAQSKEEFIQAIKDIQSVVTTGLERSRQRAGGGTGGSTAADQAYEKIARNPNTGERIGLRNGKWEPIP